MAQNKKRVEWGVHIHRYNLTEQNQYHPVSYTHLTLPTKA